MKQLIIILLLVPVLGFGQVKGDNTIKIEGVSFRFVADVLLDNGIAIDKSDSSLGTIKTEPIKLKGVNAYYLVNIRVKDSIATLTGSLNMPALDNSWEPVDYSGMKGSPARKAFDGFVDVASLFKKPILFTRVN